VLQSYGFTSDELKSLEKELIMSIDRHHSKTVRLYKEEFTYEQKIDPNATK